ncbi:MAG TPA: hypothetical protein VMT52_14690 [Planctomycetota bacterium]|nr:hypothetical protein [Planctomycetota bacterium]
MMMPPRERGRAARGGCSIAAMALLPALLVLTSCAPRPLFDDEGREGPGAASPATPREAPVHFEMRGRLVCLPEALRDRYGAAVPPVHEHVLALALEVERKDAEPRAGDMAYLTILRTPLAERLFADERFRAHTLVLTGRRFPGTTTGEVVACQWIRDGKLYEVDYWCSVCSIKTADPGPCACCQAAVELRETPASPQSEKSLPRSPRSR